NPIGRRWPRCTNAGPRRPPAAWPPTSLSENPRPSLPPTGSLSPAADRFPQAERLAWRHAVISPEHPGPDHDPRARRLLRWGVEPRLRELRGPVIGPNRFAVPGRTAVRGADGPV